MARGRGYGRASAGVLAPPAGELADLSVTTQKLAAGAVTAAKASLELARQSGLDDEAATRAQAIIDEAEAREAGDQANAGSYNIVSDGAATEGGDLGVVMQDIVDDIIANGDGDARSFNIFLPPGDWDWDTPCYIDPAAGQFYIRMQGSGKGATTIHPSTGLNGNFCIRNNDDRTDPGTSVNESNGQMPRLEVSHLTVDGPADGTPEDTTSASFIMDNDACTHMHSVRLSGLKYGVHTEGYSDGHNLTHCVWLTPAPDGFLYHQTDVGDALFIANCKGGSNAPLISLNNCNGGVLTAIVGGVSKIRNSRGIVVLGHHWDSNVGTGMSAYRAAWDIGGSGVTFVNPWWHAGPDKAHVQWALSYIEINDSTTSPDRGSDVLVLHPNAGARLDGNADKRNADINIYTGNLGQTRLRVVGSKYGVYTRSISDPYREAISVAAKTYPKDGSTITYPLAASDAALDTLLATQKSGVIFATGDFELRGNKPAATWDLRPLHAGGIRSSRQLTAPTITTTSPSDGTGDIANGTRKYVIACMNADGHYGPLSAVKTHTVTNGNVQIMANASDAAQTWRIWYADGGTDPSTTPTAYVDIPCDGSQLLARDHGVGVNMRLWISTSVPIPNTVAAANETWNGLVLANGRRVMVGDAATTPEARLYGSPGDFYTTTAGVPYIKATGAETKTGWMPLGLGVLGYTSAVSAGSTTTSATYSNCDTTALSVTFTAPPSGQVIIRASAGFSTAAVGSPVFLNLRDSVGGDISGTNVDVAVKNTNITRPAYEQRIGSLTPGTSYTVRLGWKIGGGTLATLSADRCSIVAQAA